MAALGVAATVVVAAACSAAATAPADGPASSDTTSSPSDSTPAASGATPAASSTARTAPGGTDPAVADAFERLEREHDARVGLYAVDTGSGQVVAHRAGERFPYASTFKALATGAVLERTSPAELDEIIEYDADDLVEYSPVTEKHAGKGMPLRAVIDAAIQYSDNTAGNLLLEELGGPAGLQRALRDIGDTTTVASRWETELNDYAPGDERDTSTPEALATDLRTYAVDDHLDDADRDLLTTSLRGNTTGDARIRAGVPDDWTVGDKTGTAGVYGNANDIGIATPPQGDPIVLAVLTRTENRQDDHDDALVAAATRLAVDTLTAPAGSGS